MKIKELLNFRLLAGIIVAASITSCGKSNSNVSTATGWKINDSKGGFQYNTKYEQRTPNGMVPVEGGTFTMGRVQDDILADWNNNPKEMYVQSFYMDETETTNIMYNEYLYWLRTVYPQNNELYQEIYKSAIPDTTVWRGPSGFNESLITSYLRHPAYANYPVVGVTWVQANDYAKWRTDRVNELALEKAGYLKKDAKILDAASDAHFSTDTYLSSPESVYGGNSDIAYKGKDNKAKEGDRNLYATQNSGLFTSQFRLPTEAEWEYAAIGLIGNREYNNYKGRKKYPWDKSSKRKKGKPIVQNTKYANYKQGRGDYGGIAGWSTDNGDITNAVKSYPPNDFGLYDMSGNVAEWVADVYDPAIDQNETDFNFYKGNVYYKNKIGADGKIEITTNETVRFDTLSTGKLRARNLPGQVAQEIFDPSLLDDNAQNGLGGRIKGEAPTPLRKATLYDEKSRVIKGGSWKDRAYWLDPATRRYFPEDQATDYIGFRLVMTKVGPKSDKRKTKN